MTIPPDKSDMIFSSQPVRANPTVPQAPGTGFQAYTPGTAGPAKPFAGPSAAQGPAAVGPSFVGQAATPSFDTLIAQVSTSQDSYSNIRNLLNTKNLQFKRSQQHLLRNKLSDASTYLRAANNRLGAEVPAMPNQSGARPIERFINLVSDGENQLAAAQHQISDMQKKGDQLRPGDFLLIQVKLAQAQQEIEYSSMLLSKVVDSIKATLNIAL